MKIFRFLVTPSTEKSVCAALIINSVFTLKLETKCNTGHAKKGAVWFPRACDVLSLIKMWIKNISSNLTGFRLKTEVRLLEGAGIFF